MGNPTIKGGISSTDIPIRTCAQDAQHLGGVAQSKGTEADKQLVQLTLQNLSQLHNAPREKFGRLVDHYAYNWHNDENAHGAAFVLFGPGQFGQLKQGHSMFGSMNAPRTPLAYCW
ncbi:hypothetical protein K474DRAFT_1752665 [Panus rudis PR-1116 ss-1]|nr:hypothetical protein K474DRAFT_1752665 [Panus rudis PR-1116 ss-1]